MEAPAGFVDCDAEGSFVDSPVVGGELGEGLYFAFAEDVPEADDLISDILTDRIEGFKYPGTPISYTTMACRRAQENRR